MVKLFATEHTFNHPFERVSRGWHRSGRREFSLLLPLAGLTGFSLLLIVRSSGDERFLA
jgi:hypothetical protein